MPTTILYDFDSPRRLGGSASIVIVAFVVAIVVAVVMSICLCFPFAYPWQNFIFFSPFRCFFGLPLVLF